MQNPSSSDRYLAFALMIGAMFCFSVMTIGVRWVSETMGSMQMVFLRNVMSFFLILLWVQFRHDKKFHVTQRPWRHITRGAVGFVAMEVWFFSLVILPLTFATALSFTTPIFGTIMAILMLREKAGWRRWMAIGFGFAGVLIILNPGASEVSLGGIIVLVASALMALSGTLVKTLTRSESPETIVFYMILVMTPLSLFPALTQWKSFGWEETFGIFFIAFTSTAAHLLMTRAMMRADMVMLLPLDFLRLVFTAIGAYFVFHETMTGNTLIGGLVILLSTAYIVHRERVVDKKYYKKPNMIGN